VAQALATGRGSVLVTAYALPDAARTARLASASQLADEWARRVAQVLARQLPDGSVASEGRLASVDAVASAPGLGAPGRRNTIEITWFP
jgi:hypothetical protein